MIETLMVLIGTLGGTYLGHYLTMKAFSHVQPSTKEVMFNIKGGVTTEQDPWSDEIKDDTRESTFSSSQTPEEILEEIKRKTGRQPEDMYSVNA